mmetsp:Transcript_39536/g.92377  ORF Transcript_39536/g.92377 Transcript_39536/m.92377 type:complete len:242 (-) Transcript_39536:364-1089(-)
MTQHVSSIDRYQSPLFVILLIYTSALHHGTLHFELLLVASAPTIPRCITSPFWRTSSCVPGGQHYHLLFSSLLPNNKNEWAARRLEQPSVRSLLRVPHPPSHDACGAHRNRTLYVSSPSIARMTRRRASVRFQRRRFRFPHKSVGPKGGRFRRRFRVDSLFPRPAKNGARRELPPPSRRRHGTMLCAPVCNPLPPPVLRHPPPPLAYRRFRNPNSTTWQCLSTPSGLVCCGRKIVLRRVGM